MIESIAYAILLFAAIIGFVHIFGLLEHRLLFRDRGTSVISLVPLNGHIEEVEILVRDLISSQHWNHKEQGTIVLVDIGLDEETRDICEKISKDHSGIIVCDNCELKNLLQISIGCK